MKVRGLLATGIATAAAAILCTSPAFAAQSNHAMTTDDAGFAEFRATGESFRVCDNAKDGMEVRLMAEWLNEGKSLIVGGKGKCTKVPAHIAEGISVRLKVCLLDKNFKMHRCSKWVWGVA
ncbi:hypothetical protein ABT112_03905 [Streptomyces sp. NPDC002055]|uniref:hypothetical protein n=1 Tax=Streptomyces sp. NPDC002055 TaxID=3154534 RepID=UPI003323CEA6